MIKKYSSILNSDSPYLSDEYWIISGEIIDANQYGHVPTIGKIIEKKQNLSEKEKAYLKSKDNPSVNGVDLRELAMVDWGAIRVDGKDIELLAPLTPSKMREIAKGLQKLYKTQAMTFKYNLDLVPQDLKYSQIKAFERVPFEVFLNEDLNSLPYYAYRSFSSKVKKLAIKFEIKSQTTFEPRPADVPEGWYIFVAPRPIFGEKQWRGSGGHGWHYSAVDPQDSYMYQIHLKSLKLADARLLIFVTDVEFKKWLHEEVKDPKERLDILQDPMIISAYKDNFLRSQEDKVVEL